LKQKIIDKFGIGCFDPPNGTTIVIDTTHSIPLQISTKILKRAREDAVNETGNLLFYHLPHNIKQTNKQNK
jgi:hypothetical protein